MPVTRWSTSIEWPIMVEHCADTEVRRVGSRINRKGHTRSNTSKIETINDIGVHGSLLGF